MNHEFSRRKRRFGGFRLGLNPGGVTLNLDLGEKVNQRKREVNELCKEGQAGNSAEEEGGFEVLKDAYKEGKSGQRHEASETWSAALGRKPTSLMRKVMRDEKEVGRTGKKQASLIDAPRSGQ